MSSVSAVNLKKKKKNNRTKLNIILLFLFAFVTLSASLISADAIAEDLHLNIQTIYDNGKKNGKWR